MGGPGDTLVKEIVQYELKGVFPARFLEPNEPPPSPEVHCHLAAGW